MKAKQTVRGQGSASENQSVASRREQSIRRASPLTACLRALLTHALVALVSGGVGASLGAREPGRTVKGESAKELADLQPQRRVCECRLAYTKGALGRLEPDVDGLEQQVTVLGTTEMASRMSELEESWRELRAIINPTNAADILSVARMREEILARQQLEQHVDRSLQAIQHKLNDVEKRLAALLYWLLGALSAIIGGLCAVIVYLVKRLRDPAPLRTTSRMPGAAGRPSDSPYTAGGCHAP